ncbi:dITP/XTP pyrophosphatase [Commensalibacter sp. Nvir]|uniref:RdgB/HAM1 family non-canonical purine NTP pyrophosphatase n=1 Tax=Commensalibacter sp. Nvir TaxID=3069817 RepID=UPI002D74221F|nr:dITP/XTP pyrophosphatase [Commensalibacter sp. Nvir]
MTALFKLKAGNTLLVATHNSGKINEIKSLLSPFSIKVYSAKDLNLPEPEETGLTFEENAKIKASFAAKLTQKICLADDSGFCLNGLKGEPGIYSSRWAGPDQNYARAMHLIKNKLTGKSDRSAYFVCMLCVASPNNIVKYFEGRVDGQFVWPPRGENGHGYDPIFQPNHSEKTFAEMTELEKNSISHRGKALQRFLKECL